MPSSANSYRLKLEQLYDYPCNVCTSDSGGWPVTCFAHNLMWQTHQLVHIGDDLDW